MNWKAILKVLGLFVSGLILGMVLTGFLIRNHFENMKGTFEGKGFAEHMIENIEVEEQDKEVLKSLMYQYGNELRELHEDFKLKREGLIDSMIIQGAQQLDISKEAFREKLKKAKRGMRPPPHHQKPRKRKKKRD